MWCDCIKFNPVHSLPHLASSHRKGNSVSHRQEGGGEERWGQSSLASHSIHFSWGVFLPSSHFLIGIVFNLLPIHETAVASNFHCSTSLTTISWNITWSLESTSIAKVRYKKGCPRKNRGWKVKVGMRENRDDGLECLKYFKGKILPLLPGDI